MSQGSTTTRSSSSPKVSSKPGEQDASKDCELGECEDFQALVDDVTASVTRYCRQRPTAAALGLFALGFFVGWKIKPW